MPIELGDGDVLVAPPVLPAIVTAPPADADVLVLPVAGTRGPPGAPGEPGEQGPIGPAGGSFYVHTQTDPASVWVIDHGLGRKVHVTVFDPTDTVIYADVEHGSIDQTTVSFPSPVLGSAVLG